MADPVRPLTHALTRPPTLRLADLEILRQGAPPVVPWTPLDLGVKLKAWWSADDHGTARMVDDGAGLISSWTDKVGGLAVTGGTTARPTWTGTAFNTSYSGLTFNGTTNCLTLTNASALPTGAVAGEMWCVCSFPLPGATAGTHIAMRYGLGGVTSRVLQRVNVTNVNRSSVSDGTTGLNETLIDFSGPHIFGGAWAGTTETGRIDGRATTPASAVIATLATATDRLRFGASSAVGPTAFWSGIIRHGFVTTPLTLGEQEKLEGWCAHNSGLTSVLPGGHPYKSAAP